jgi:hypothetical protein
MKMAASRTVRVMGPCTEVSFHCCIPSAMLCGMRPYEVLRPKHPVKHAGIRTEPPPSEPVTIGTTPPEIAAELPPDDPPGVRSRFHGLRVTPKSRFLVCAV